MIKNISDKLKKIYKYLVLKYHFKIKKFGKDVDFSKDFSIFNGSQNIVIGNNVALQDALINAGDSIGSITIGDYVFFGHRIMLLARGHDYNQTLLDR
jgi:acetyltransferase-like isoleucine patch superfamily enzyme